VIYFRGRFAWYELITTEAETAKAFYRKVMGWGILDASVPGRSYTLFAAGNDLASGLMDLPEEVQRTGGKPAWIGYIGVDDVDATAGRITHLGGTVHVPPTDVHQRQPVLDLRGSANRKTRAAEMGTTAPTEASRLGHNWPSRLARIELSSDWQTAFAFYSELFGWQSADIGEMGTYPTLRFGRSRDRRNGHQSPSRARSFLALLL
jgi:predicted enzyme related to lactoylglutathione lyase